MLRVHAEFTHRHRYARVIELENGVFSFDVAPGILFMKVGNQNADLPYRH